MPQIWMTYDEIADLVGCRPEYIRALAAARSLDRKKSLDGQTRVKLDMLWTAMFVERIRETDPELDRAIASLRQIHGEMTRTQGVALRLEPRAAASTGISDKALDWFPTMRRMHF